MVNKQKGEKQSELDKIYADAKAKVTRETESAIAGGWGCLLLMLPMPFCVSPALVAAATRQQHINSAHQQAAS
jgi:F0F1-type ATP synthase membrane subunit b/b'